MADGGAGATDLSRVRVSLATRGPQTFEMGGTPPAQADANGHFTITGVAPGRYTLRVESAGRLGNGQAAAGAAGGAARPDAARRGAGGSGRWSRPWSNGRDILDFPVDIGPNEPISNAVLTFTDKTQELSGTIQDASGRPTADFTIVLFPSDSRYWLPQSRRIASTRPGTDGRFTIRGIPPGDYRLTAVTDVEPGEWYDPIVPRPDAGRVDSDQHRRRRQESAGHQAGRRVDAGAPAPRPSRAPHRHPDERHEHQHRRDEGPGEQPQRAVENRLRVHPHVHVTGSPARRSRSHCSHVRMLPRSGSPFEPSSSRLTL